MNSQQNNNQIIQEDYSDFKKGISIQREIYKNANLNNDYDTMVKCIENIKIEVKQKAIKKRNEKDIEYIEKAIQWYRMLPSKYKKRTQEGIIYNYPENLHIQINQNLNRAYEKIINILTILDLI